MFVHIYRTDKIIKSVASPSEYSRKLSRLLARPGELVIQLVNRMIGVIRSLHDEATSAVLLNESIWDFFRTTADVYDRVAHYIQYYLINFWKRKCRRFRHLSDTLGQPLCNLWFADDIDYLLGSEEELQELTERVEKTAAGYGMEISFAKSEIFVHSI